MIVKRKLFSFIDEDGNQGYYLYNESTGEEKLFSVVEEEREFAKKENELDEEDIKFLEEQDKNKRRNHNNIGIKKLASTSAKVGLSGYMLNEISKMPTKTGKFVKKHKLPAAGVLTGAALLDLYQAKKDREKYNELHDKVKHVYVNSDKETRKSIRNMSNKKRLKMAYNKQIEEN